MGGSCLFAIIFLGVCEKKGKENKKKMVAHKLAEALKQMVADSLGQNQAATDMINEFTEL